MFGRKKKPTEAKSLRPDLEAALAEANRDLSGRKAEKAAKKRADWARGLRLRDDEQVRAVAVPASPKRAKDAGVTEGGPGVLAVTDKRVLFHSKMLKTEQNESVPLRTVTAVNVKTGVRGVTWLTIETAGGAQLEFIGGKDRFDPVYDAIERGREELA